MLTLELFNGEQQTIEWKITRNDFLSKLGNAQEISFKDRNGKTKRIKISVLTDDFLLEVPDDVFHALARRSTKKLPCKLRHRSKPAWITCRIKFYPRHDIPSLYVYVEDKNSIIRTVGFFVSAPHFSGAELHKLLSGKIVSETPEFSKVKVYLTKRDSDLVVILHYFKDLECEVREGRYSAVTFRESKFFKESTINLGQDYTPRVILEPINKVVIFDIVFDRRRFPELEEFWTPVPISLKSGEVYLPLRQNNTQQMRRYSGELPLYIYEKVTKNGGMTAANVVLDSLYKARQVFKQKESTRETLFQCEIEPILTAIPLDIRVQDVHYRNTKRHVPLDTTERKWQDLDIRLMYRDTPLTDRVNLRNSPPELSVLPIPRKVYTLMISLPDDDYKPWEGRFAGTPNYISQIRLDLKTGVVSLSLPLEGDWRCSEISSAPDSMFVSSTIDTAGRAVSFEYFDRGMEFFQKEFPLAISLAPKEREKWTILAGEVGKAKGNRIFVDFFRSAGPISITDYSLRRNLRERTFSLNFELSAIVSQSVEIPYSVKPGCGRRAQQRPFKFWAFRSLSQRDDFSFKWPVVADKNDFVELEFEVPKGYSYKKKRSGVAIERFNLLEKDSTISVKLEALPKIPVIYYDISEGLVPHKSVEEWVRDKHDHGETPFLYVSNGFESSYNSKAENSDLDEVIRQAYLYDIRISNINRGLAELLNAYDVSEISRDEGAYRYPQLHLILSDNTINNIRSNPNPLMEKLRTLEQEGRIRGHPQYGRPDIVFHVRKKNEKAIDILYDLGFEVREPF